MRRLVLLAAAWAFSAAAAAQDIESLERSLEKARNEAPLVVKPFMLVSRPAKYFGDYQQRADATFLHGDPILFYLEIKNLVTAKNAQGLYEPAFAVDLEIVEPSGKVKRTPDFGKLRVPSRSRVQDIYVQLAVPFEKAPAATYTVRFIVRDLNSKKSATVEQALTVR